MKYNKANQHGSLKASRKKRATLLTPSYLRRYICKSAIAIFSRELLEYYLMLKQESHRGVIR